MCFNKTKKLIGTMLQFLHIFNMYLNTNTFFLLKPPKILLSHHYFFAVKIQKKSISRFIFFQIFGLYCALVSKTCSLNDFSKDAPLQPPQEAWSSRWPESSCASRCRAWGCTAETGCERPVRGLWVGRNIWAVTEDPLGLAAPGTAGGFVSGPALHTT